MDTKRAYEVMCALEERLPVNQYLYRGVNVWPYIKTSLYIKILGVINPGSGRKLAKNRSTGSILVSWYRNFGRFLRTSRALWGRNSIGVVCPGSHCDVDVDGVLHNRSTFSVNQYLSDVRAKPAFNIEYSNSERYFLREKKFPAIDLTFFFSLLNDFTIFCIKKTRNRGSGSLLFVENINRELKQLEVPIVLSNHSLAWEIRRLFVLSLFFKGLFMFKGVKKLVVICYYNHISLAACKAANELGIQTIEYQHGIQNKYQPMYNTWFNVPNDGYTLVPKVFAVWSDYNYKNIQSWASQSHFHSVRIAGNGFANLFSERSKNSRSTDLYHREEYSKKILVTLQSERYFPRFLDDAIRLAPKSWLWVLKEHPNHKIVTVPGVALADLKQQPNVIWEQSRQLFEILPEIDVHATAFSTVAFEALEFGVSTVFFDAVAKTCFDDLVFDTALFSFAFDAQSLIEVIESRCHQGLGSTSKIFSDFNGARLFDETEACI